MSHRRRPRRAAAIVAMLPAILLPAAPSASADPLLPIAVVYIDHWTGNVVSICASGDVNDGATTIARWVFTIVGAVTDSVGPQDVTVDDGDTFFQCADFYAGSPPDAAFTATLQFAGIGVGSDVHGFAALIYEWNTALGHANHFTVSSSG